jgi:putative phage-type endonuclease
MDAKFAIDRNSGIGGSDVATILGFNKYKTREELFLEKTGRGVEFKGNKYTELGNKYEDSIAEHFKKAYGLTGEFKEKFKKPESYRSEKYPHLVANADFLFQTGDRVDAILEIKTSQLKNKNKWIIRGADLENVYWYPYYWQILHYLITYGRTRGFLYCQFFEDEKPTNEFYYAVIDIGKECGGYASIMDSGMTLIANGDAVNFLITETKKFWDEVIKWRKENEN